MLAKQIFQLKGVFTLQRYLSINRSKEDRNKTITNFLPERYQDITLWYKSFLYLGFFYLLIVCADSIYAVPVETLRAPMQAMKKEVWSYLFPIKVASVVVGSAFSLMRQSLMPFGIGAGISASIQFFDSILGDGSAALI